MAKNELPRSGYYGEQCDHRGEVQLTLGIKIGVKIFKMDQNSYVTERDMGR